VPEGVNLEDMLHCT
jgi:26S proteasome regulatory subunit N3